ncbi:MAG TPA: flagellar motor stator protein MotA [Bryobacteraceae bacterium]|nr:flagellar motor stator protein MotA [Bryobacteraceae bacterium]
MLPIIGVLVVFGAIIGGYLMEHGQLGVLVQPAELVIIGGAVVGTMLISNPVYVLKALGGGVGRVFKPEEWNKSRYLETLQMLFKLFTSARTEGAAKLEADIEQPENSAIFTPYPWFLKDHRASRYLSDTLRLYMLGGIAPHQIDRAMEIDDETHDAEATLPVSALQTAADSLPGLGIVAAVLGIVITMGALGGPPEEIGHKVAAALVGTFLGILLCYGFLGPIATRISQVNEADAQYYGCLRNGIQAFVRGDAPIVAVEFARRSIPDRLRPSFQEMEQACKKAKDAPAAEATAA